MLKIVAKSFCPYIRDAWNLLDAVVVVEGWFAFILAGESDALVALRVFRVLRPLRTIKRVPSLRALTRALVEAVQRLQDIVLFLIFVVGMFGVVGVLLWNGLFRNRCGTSEDDYVETQLCRPKISIRDTCAAMDRFRVKSADSCSSGQTCLDVGENPNYGFTSFDNIGVAVLNLATVLTLEGWRELVEQTAAVSNNYTWFFFVAIVILCAFMIMQLLGAIILARLQILIR